jgi:hypothetical protein
MKVEEVSTILHVIFYLKRCILSELRKNEFRPAGARQAGSPPMYTFERPLPVAAWTAKDVPTVAEMRRIADREPRKPSGADAWRSPNRRLARLNGVRKNEGLRWRANFVQAGVFDWSTF